MTRRIVALMFVALAAGLWPALPAGAEDEISVTPDQIIVADPGTLTTVTVEQVPADLVGKICLLTVVAENGSSVHPGNALVVTTGGDTTTVAGVEDDPDGQVVGAHDVELASTIEFQLQMGPDGISSLGFSVGIDCDPPPASTTPPATVLPAQQEATPTTVAPAAPVPAAPTAKAVTAAPTYTG